eukprot:GHVO01058862.1.p1 GENE.GHVO01058862.1~~GHVO01058862.1.p1  ORF type:complete len:260 (-),score=20.80 GHVO01058862.1:223-1002(-)
MMMSEDNHGLKLGKMLTFAGKKEDFPSFRNSYTLQFSMKEYTDHAKIATVLFNLSDEAALWHNSFMKEYQSTLTSMSWDTFEGHLTKQFTNPNIRIKAHHLLQNRTQGDKEPLELFIADFQRLAAEAEVTDEVILTILFQKGVKQAITKPIFLSGTLPESLVDWMARVRQTDTHWHLFRTIHKTDVATHLLSKGNKNVKDPNAMDVDHSKGKTIRKLTPAERDKCAREGLCFRCRQAGHLANKCPGPSNDWKGKKKTVV